MFGTPYSRKDGVAGKRRCENLSRRLHPLGCSGRYAAAAVLPKNVQPRRRYRDPVITLEESAGNTIRSTLAGRPWKDDCVSTISPDRGQWAIFSPAVQILQSNSGPPSVIFLSTERDHASLRQATLPSYCEPRKEERRHSQTAADDHRKA